MGCLNYTVAPKCWKGEKNLYAPHSQQNIQNLARYNFDGTSIDIEKGQHGNLLSGVLMAWTMGIVGGLYRVGGT